MTLRTKPTRAYSTATPAMLEQYMQLLESTDHTSERRQTVHAFFVTIHTLIATAVGFLLNGDSTTFVDSYILLAASVLGLLLVSIWYRITSAYRVLTGIKFAVIKEMEQDMPYATYTYESKLTKQEKKYSSISKVELQIPVVFCLLYICCGAYGLMLIGM